MDFVSIQNEVMSDRFRGDQRDRVKLWINSAYADIWTMEEWTFRFAEDQVTVTTSSTAVTDLPTDLGAVMGMWNSEGDRISYITPGEWSDLYYGETSTGKPEFYTINPAGTLVVGPISNETDTGYKIRYEKLRVDLDGPQDVPLLPSSSHFVLVHAACEIGLAMENDYPTADIQRGMKEDKLAGMRSQYLEVQRGEFEQWGSFDPETEYWVGI